MLARVSTRWRNDDDDDDDDELQGEGRVQADAQQHSLAHAGNWYVRFPQPPFVPLPSSWCWWGGGGSTSKRVTGVLTRKQHMYERTTGHRPP